MPPLTDPIRLAAYRDALGNWNVGDYIQFELTLQARRWIKRELDGVTLNEIKRLMYEHVAAGGEIEQWAASRGARSESSRAFR